MARRKDEVRTERKERWKKTSTRRKLLNTCCCNSVVREFTRRLHTHGQVARGGEVAGQVAQQEAA